MTAGGVLMVYTVKAQGLIYIIVCLHWLCVSEQVQFPIAVLAYKVLH